MNTSYAMETLARQRMDQTSRQARTAHERREIRARPGRRFPKVTFPSRPGVFIPRPA